MTDLEKVKRCAEKMGIRIVVWNGVARIADADGKIDDEESPCYDPLTNKAQAFDLLERFPIAVNAVRDHGVVVACEGSDGWAHYYDLCRAIVECVAQMPCCPVSVNSPDSMTAK